jgi:hypothetical protein
MAQVAAELVAKPEYSEPSQPLLARFFDDPDKDVRRQVLTTLHFEKLLKQSDFIPFLRHFVGWKTFRDDAFQVLHSLKHYSGSLVPLADLIFDVAHHLCEGQDIEDTDAVRRMGRAGDEISPVLLRLYEQSEGAEGDVVRQRCLDAWDNLLERGITAAWSLTRQLDQA